MAIYHVKHHRLLPTPSERKYLEEHLTDYIQQLKENPSKTIQIIEHPLGLLVWALTCDTSNLSKDTLQNYSFDNYTIEKVDAQ